ncbi:MAG TPA: hypothetical protein VKB95_09805, partial [Chitinophagaceae bacterium]|nr:hypothetical protein [Chitinophagaceae bacterium]
MNNNPYFKGVHFKIKYRFKCANNTSVREIASKKIPGHLHEPMSRELQLRKSLIYCYRPSVGRGKYIYIILR